jgi:hypothetical protein
MNLGKDKTLRVTDAVQMVLSWSIHVCGRQGLIISLRVIILDPVVGVLPVELKRHDWLQRK